MAAENARAASVSLGANEGGGSTEHVEGVESRIDLNVYDIILASVRSSYLNKAFLIKKN